MRPRGVLAVCLLLVIAGCGGSLGGDSTADSSATGTGATTATDNGLPFPTGYNESGIDGNRAFNTHFAALDNSSYRLNVRLNSSRANLTFSEHGSPSGALGELSLGDRTFTVWDGDRLVFRQETPSGTQIGTAVGPESAIGRVVGVGGVIAFERNAVGVLLRGVTYEYAGTVTRDGMRLHKYTAVNGTNLLTGTGSTLESVDGRLFVDRRGRVRSASVSVTRRNVNTNETTTSTFSVSMSNVGTAEPVTKPEWVSQAPTVSASFSDGVLAITNEGDEPISGRVVVSAFENFVTSLEKPIAPGDTVYLVPGESSPVIERNDPGSVSPDAWPNDQFAVRVVSDNGPIIVGANVSAGRPALQPSADGAELTPRSPSRATVSVG